MGPAEVEKPKKVGFVVVVAGNFIKTIEQLTRASTDIIPLNIHQHQIENNGQKDSE